MKNGTLEEAAAVVRRVELLTISGAKEQAGRAAEAAEAAIHEAQENGLGTPDEIGQLAMRLQVAIQRGTRQA